MVTLVYSMRWKGEKFESPAIKWFKIFEIIVSTIGFCQQNWWRLGLGFWASIGFFFLIPNLVPNWAKMKTKIYLNSKSRFFCRTPDASQNFFFCFGIKPSFTLDKIINIWNNSLKHDFCNLFARGSVLFFCVSTEKKKKNCQRKCWIKKIH